MNAVDDEQRAVTTVVNLRRCRREEHEVVYIGRGSIYGNPFSHLPSRFGTVEVASREEAVARFREWVTSTDVHVPGWRKPSAEDIEFLRGKRLGCYCAPSACHGDVYIELLGER
jgi:hypothetical protein